MNEGLLAGNLIVPQVQVSPLGAHSHSGGVSGMPLQAGDPAVEGAGGAVEVIRRQRANVRLLKTLQRERSCTPRRNVSTTCDGTVLQYSTRTYPHKNEATNILQRQ